jgi:hypothetical protein
MARVVSLGPHTIIYELVIGVQGPIDPFENAFQLHAYFGRAHSYRGGSVNPKTNFGYNGNVSYSGLRITVGVLHGRGFVPSASIRSSALDGDRFRLYDPVLEYPFLA